MDEPRAKKTKLSKDSKPFASCICDEDNDKITHKIENLFYTKQYSYENYLLNPINLYLLLKHSLPDDALIQDRDDKNAELKNPIHSKGSTSTHSRQDNWETRLVCQWEI